ncbi:hypothetical protein HanRHA438_Chr09g0403631 [Helianthus annuus]|nr:hypothetical protein HanRHA438_Chr09g0403631 [Helianthus annuus]
MFGTCLHVRSDSSANFVALYPISLHVHCDASAKFVYSRPCWVRLLMIKLFTVIPVRLGDGFLLDDKSDVSNIGRFSNLLILDD